LASVDESIAGRFTALSEAARGDRPMSLRVRVLVACSLSLSLCLSVERALSLPYDNYYNRLSVAR